MVTKFKIITEKMSKIEDSKIDIDSNTEDVDYSFLYELAKYHNADERVGLASCKNRSAVRGGGAKPYKQKGTGRARRGTNNTPLRRGGGVIFG